MEVWQKSSECDGSIHYIVKDTIFIVTQKATFTFLNATFINKIIMVAHIVAWLK